MESDTSYRINADAAIRDLLLDFECQPILFIGSGMSRRYFNGPNWIELLRTLFDKLPDQGHDFEYYVQKFEGDAIAVGTALSDLTFEWAWGKGRPIFPEKYFSETSGKDIFLKHLATEHIKKITPSISKMKDETLVKEISSLSEIKPHAIITTNYDVFLEKIFKGYETITGQTILRYNTNSFGEIYHIHGDVSDPQSLVLTGVDYNEWTEKKKYVSAKLLTYFAEHPVFIFGYGIGDPNVKSILRDIGEIVAQEDGLIPNVYQIVWHEKPVEKHPPTQAVIAVDGKEYRIQAVHTNDLKWIFDALKSRSALTSINPKLVRALAARTMRLIRHDIPSGAVKVNYDILERVASEEDQLPKLLGITSIENPNQSHPYTLTQVAKRIGLPNWQAANKLLHKIKEQKGIDIRSTDNRYHCKIKTGVKVTSATRKWSHEGVDLLKKVRKGEPYDIVIE